MRPVTTLDFFVEAPIPEPIDFSVNLLHSDTASNRAAIENSVAQMLRERARPGSSSNGVLIEGTVIYEAWISEAISEVLTDFQLTMEDHPMPHNGALAVLGTVTYET